jgi:hypothetical protein
MTALELSFQFPIKRDGASPVVAAAAVVVASGVADAESDGIADALAAGVAAESSEFFFEFEITIPPRRTTPTSTNKRTLLEDPCLGASDGFGVAFAATGRDAATGVVETLTRDPPVVGTGGITTFEVVDFFAADFLTAFFATFFAGAFFATFFAVAFFFAAVFFTTFLAAVFLAGDFLAAFFAVDFFAVDFLGAAFFAALFFFTATVYLLELCNGGIWEKFNLGI